MRYLSHRQMNPSESGVLVKAICGVIACLLILPMVVVVGLALNESSYLQFPPKGLSLDALHSVADSGEWRRAFEQSVKVAILSAPLATLLGLAAAVGLRRVIRFRRLLQTLLILPLVVPLISTSLAVYPIYSDFNLLGTTHGLILAHSMVALPFAYLTLSSALATLDPQLERAAASLGANWFAVLRRVIVPSVAPAIFAALAISVAVSFDEVVVTLYISDPATRTVPVLVWASLRDSLGTEIAAAALLIVVVNLVIMAIAVVTSRWAMRRRGGGGLV